jgi:hypothetical protein
MLGGCTDREPKTVVPPKEAAAVIEPFLIELAAGNKDKAGAFVSSAATDELAAQFATDHEKLAASGKLTPRFVNQSGNDPRRLSENAGADGSEVTVVYAAKSGDKWTTATVRVYKYRDDPYKVEYWRVANDAPKKPLPSSIDQKQLEKTEAIGNAMAVGFSLLGILGIGLLIWLIRRRPQLLVPEQTTETRRSASTVREPDEE